MAIQTYEIITAQDTSYHSYQSQGYPTLTRLLLGIQSGNQFNALIDFKDSLLTQFLDLEGVESTDQIVKAELFLYARYTQTVNNPNMVVLRVTESWNAQQVSGSNNPSTTTQDIFQLQANPFNGVANNLSKCDITEFVKGWINETYPIHGVKLQPTSSLGGVGAFHSVESGDRDYRPKLVITYDDTPPVPPEMETGIYELAPTQDTFYGDFLSTQGRPTSQALAVGGWGDRYDAFIDFDETAVEAFLNLPLVTTTDQITKAELYLYSRTDNKNNPFVNALRITEPWVDTEVNEDNHPDVTGVDSYELQENPYTAIGKLSKLDITNIVKGWINDEYPCYGIRLHPRRHNNATNGSFYSTDAEETQYHPKLVITYTPNETLSEIPLTYRVVTQKDITKSGINPNLPPAQQPQPKPPISLHYRVVDPNAIEKSLTYRVKTSPQTNKELDYRVMQQNSVAKELKYSVRYRGDLDTNQDDIYRLNDV